MKSYKVLPQLRIRLAKTLNLSLGLSAFAVSLLTTTSAQGATQTWTGATDGSWETASNWNATTPGLGDTAQWDTPSTANLSLTLGTAQSVLGLKVANPSGAVSLSGSSLTLGSGGIDMSTATQNLTISSGLTLGAGNQTWNVTSGRTLTLDTGTFTRTAGATLNIQGSGTVSSTMTGLTTASLTNGILPWATVGTGASTRFATFSGNDLVGYTGGTATTWGGTLNSATANYEISAAGTATYGGSERVANTIRYTGPAGSVINLGNSSAFGLTVNGLINAGTGTITFQHGGGATIGAGIHIGTTNELVLNAANAAITVNARIHNNGAVAGVGGTASAVTVFGSNTVTLSAANTYTGGTFVNSGGTLVLGATNTLADAGAVTVNGGTLSLGANSDTVGAVTLQSGSITSSTGTLTGSSYDMQSGSASTKLAGAGNLTKTTAGTVSLSGANTYTGTTTVSAGTLLVNSTHAGAGAYNVNTGTLGGNGTITSTSAVTVGAAGLLSPGSAANTIDTLTLAGAGGLDISLAITSETGEFVFDLDTVAASDKISLTSGTLAIGSGLNFADFSFTTTGSVIDGNIYTLFDANLITGSLDGSSSNLTGSLGGGLSGTIGISGNDITLTVVPEPSAWAMLLGGLGLLTVLRRRRA